MQNVVCFYNNNLQARAVAQCGGKSGSQYLERPPASVRVNFSNVNVYIQLNALVTNDCKQSGPYSQCTVTICACGDDRS